MLSKQVTLHKNLILDTEYRKIAVYKNYFWDFYYQQSESVRLKIDWTIDLIRAIPIVPKKFFKKLKGTDDLWEIRVSANKGIYRIICFYDNENLIILTTGFQKKTQKTPKNEIKRAERIKKEYYESK